MTTTVVTYQRFLVLLCWAAIASPLLVFGQTAQGVQSIGSTNDLWDVRNGVTIIQNSPLNNADGTPRAYDARDMFGGGFGNYLPARGSTIFIDYMPSGFVHFVEWRTPNLVTIRAFNLHAVGDRDARSREFYESREFSSFRLKTKSPGSATFDITLYSSSPTHPYTFIDPDRLLLISSNVRPTTAQEFRAEFVNRTGVTYDGPRIWELDGFDQQILEILKQPQDVEVKVGATATFSVQAIGMEALRYQWRFNGARIVGSTSANLVLPNVTALDEGEYTVQITDDTGSVLSNPARLILFRDSDGDGLSDNFERGVGRYELVRGSFTWQEAKADAEKRGGHLATIVSQAEWDSIVAVIGSFYQGLSIWIGGTYATNTGSWKWVTGEPWGFTRWTSDAPNKIGDQDHALIIGNGLWNDYPSSLTAYYLLERGFYTDPNNADTDGDGFKDGDEYDGGSIPTDPASRPIPKIKSQPQPMNVIVGNSFSLAVAVDGFGAPVSYQWRWNGMAIPNATNATLTIANAQHVHAGRYDVVASNRVGSVTSAAGVVRITPVLDVQRLNNGFVILQLLDARPLNWRVEASENHLTWRTLGAMTYTDGLGVFLDATAVQSSRRFYRVVSP